MMRILLFVTLAIAVSGCAGANFDWRTTAGSIVRGVCSDASNCELPCTLPESRRSECENRAPGSPGARRT